MKRCAYCGSFYDVEHRCGEPVRVNSEPVHAVNKSVHAATDAVHAVEDRKAYRREWMKRKRAAAKAKELAQ